MTPQATMLQVMTDVIARGGEDIQLRATDVLLSSLQHDAALLRDFLEQQPEHRLMKLLVELLTRGKDGGVQEQVTVAPIPLGSGQVAVSALANKQADACISVPWPRAGNAVTRCCNCWPAACLMLHVYPALSGSCCVSGPSSQFAVQLHTDAQPCSGKRPKSSRAAAGQ